MVMILKTELQSEKYSPMSHTQAAIDLNDKTIPAKQEIPVHDIKQYLMMSGTWLAIKNSQTDNSAVAMDALQEFESFDVTNPQILAVLTAILDGLVTDITGFTSSEKAVVMAMGDKLISRGEELGLGNVTAGHVQAARMG